MPTKREREYYRMGYADGLKDGSGISSSKYEDIYVSEYAVDTVKPRPRPEYGPQGGRLTYTDITKKPKRKLSAWNKFVKANSKKPRFRYKSGAKRGKVNLKALGIAYRKKKR